MLTKPTLKRALISVYNKHGLVDFAKQLSSVDIEILATGGTAQLLRKNNIPITDISEYTSFPEMMDGRVKTLHPKIFGGLLGRRGMDDDVMKLHQIFPIDLVIVNLYPFEETISKPNCSFAEAIEQIDIGGPSLLRAAAKNHAFVTPIVDPQDYLLVWEEIKKNGHTALTTRRQLAAKVFQHTAHYDQAISNYFLRDSQEKDNGNLTSKNEMLIHLKKRSALRYGENPHQQAALFTTSNSILGLTNAHQLQGKELSYNNYIDADAALNCVKIFNVDEPACAIVKHATPCGVALGKNLKEAYQLAFRTDPESAFGGIIAVNQTLDEETAKLMTQSQFIEVLLAPSYSQKALSILSSKPNLRVLTLQNFHPTHEEKEWHIRSISGGVLIQETDCMIEDANFFKIVTKRSPTEQERQDLLFAWKIVAQVKSNAIVYAAHQATLGIGAGQTSRIFSAKIAAMKADDANLTLDKAVMASDAFFPFKDSVEFAANLGISAIIQPGGSKRDEEVIAAADAANISMILTGSRHFKH